MTNHLETFMKVNGATYIVKDRLTEELTGFFTLAAARGRMLWMIEQQRQPQLICNPFLNRDLCFR
jgi:hypothetical protein